MAILPNFLVPRRKVCLMPTAQMPFSNAANIECKTWTQSEFCAWQNSVRGQEPPKCVYSVLLAQETAKRHAKFGWPPFSDVGAVMKPRRETRWNLLLCSKHANQSQPWAKVHHTVKPCGGDMLFTKFFPIVNRCLSCEDIARESCAIVHRCRMFVYILYFERAACSTFQTCILNLH